jgi:hypothetical protein
MSINVKPKYRDIFFALTDLARLDPDNGENEPTAGMYLAFREYAINHYGKEVFRIYMFEEWQQPSEV